MSYKSIHTGQQIDAGVDAALNPDVTVTPDSDALVTSGAVADALDNIDPTITSDTDTTLNGILVGNGLKVGTKSLDTSLLTDDANHVPVSSVVKSAITNVESDLASIHATGTTNTTGATIAFGTYFYLNGALVRAKADIAVNATFTSGTNYEAVTAGGLNAVSSVRDVQITPDNTELPTTNHVQVVGNRIAVANMEVRPLVDKSGYSVIATGLPSGECWGCGYDTSGNAYPCFVQFGQLKTRKAIPMATWVRYNLTWITT